MFALVKLAAEHGITLVESLFYRQAFALVPVCIAVAMGPGFASLRTQRIGAHLSRMVMGLSAMALNFLAMIMMPMTEATVIGFSVPLFATLLAIPVLGERPGPWRWGALLLGFAGVLIVFRPDAATLHSSGTLVALAGALATAAVTIRVRQIGASEAALTIVFWFSLSSLLPLGLLMPGFASAHDSTGWLLLLAIGIVGGVGQILLTGALRLGPVAVVLPMDYSALLWSALLGWLVFQTLPTTTTLLGAPVIIASGLVILWREQKKLGKPTADVASALHE